MNLYKSILLSFILTTLTQLSFCMSQDLAAKNFVYKNLDAIEKYQMFTRGYVQGNTIFEIAFPLAEQKIPNKDMYHKLLEMDSFFWFKNNKESISKEENALIANITGFIPALKNQLGMFFILMPGILGAQSDELAKPNETEEIKEWSAQPLKSLTIKDENIAWAQQEFIIELDFFITEFSKIHDLKLKPTAHTFNIWLQGTDDWWKKEEYAKWINMFVNIMTKDRKALPVIKFTPKAMLYFLCDYIPNLLLSQDPSITNINWDVLRKQFPGFAIYEDKKLFNFAEDITRKHNMAFIVRMINQNLTTAKKRNPNIGKVATKEQTTQPKKRKSFFSPVGTD